ncbi:unnamed protein product [Caenorhabditis sp. 36 PRJEB53466]|nr:unnamed protein product [Caenorhabditis sp. 36 PRJEB53466]
MRPPPLFIYLFLVFPISILALLTSSSSAANTSSESKNRGAHNLTSWHMTHLLEKTPVFLRDSVSTDCVTFDLPKGSRGFYPIKINFTDPSSQSMSINSSGPVNIFMVKCGHHLPLGIIRKGHIWYDRERMNALSTRSCGRKWKSNFVKLLIISDVRRSVGWMKLHNRQEPLDGRESTIALCLLVTGVLIGIVLLVFTTCWRKKRDAASDGNLIEWPMSRSFQSEWSIRHVQQQLNRLIHNSDSVYEHEKEKEKEEKFFVQSQTTVFGCSQMTQLDEEDEIDDESNPIYDNISNYRYA